MLVMRGFTFFSFFAACFCSTAAHQRYASYSSRQKESMLMKKLLDNYDPEVRPLVNLSSAVDVHVTFTPIRIDDLDLRTEVLKVTGWVSMIWTDEFLRWEPDREDNLTCLLFNREEIWVPPLSVINSMRGLFISHDQTHYSKAQVCWHGVARYVLMDNYVLSCDVDITLFPFDRQTCSMKVMSWYHPRPQLRLTAGDRDMDCSHYEEDGEWDLLSTQVTVTSYNSSTHPFVDVDDVFTLVTFSLTVLRRPTYYVVNVLLPCVMLCVLVLTNFFLPPDSGEKVSLGITVLLAFTVFQLLIAEVVPTSAVCTPKLALFLICIMATSTFSIIISVFVLHLHHRTVCTHPPAWLRRLVLDLLARAMGMHNNHMMQVVLPLVDSKECLTPPTAAVGGSLHKKSSAVDTKFRLTVENRAEEQGGKNHTTTVSSDHRINLQGRKSDTDYRPCPTHLPYDMGGSEHRLNGVGSEAVQDIRRAGSSERELTCRSLNLNPDSLHTLLPAKSAVRLIQSINNLNQAAGGEKNRSHSQQAFIRAVRDVYHELRATRRTCELEHEVENEWKLIAHVVDRLFFWVTFLSLLVTAVGMFVSIS